jgi:transcriptional regulator with XRE-family HTH domain
LRQHELWKSGKRLREIRLDRRLTLEKLAKQTGLTKGYLSRIENSTQPPPIYTLSRISNALGIDISEFFAPTVNRIPYQEITIGRRNHHRLTNREGTPYGYIFEDLAPMKKGKNMEPFIVTVGFKRMIDIQKDFRHEGEEFIYVLGGRMEFFFKGQIYILEERCVYFVQTNLTRGGLGKKEKTSSLFIHIKTKSEESL